MTQVNNCKCLSPRQVRNKNKSFDRLLDPAFFKAFSDSTRVMLLACLSKCGRSCSLSEIAECSEIDLSVVSRHMSQLAATGIVNARKEGRTVYYQTNYEEMSRVFRAIAEGFEQCCCQSSNFNCGCQEK